jgi:formate hydrogenlyase subunit 6/NADH:ubiquinone oxidoreductase subunit I
MKIMPFAKTVLKNLVSTPATRNYPYTPREYTDRTRGHIQVDMDTCVLCGLCSKKCPANAITVDRAARTWSIERFGCIQCGYCVESCAKKSLSMQHTYTEPNSDKRTDTFVKPPEPPKEPAAAPAAPKAPAAAPADSADEAKEPAAHE